MARMRTLALLGVLFLAGGLVADAPLPKHAVVRIGSTAWRAPDANDFAIAPDGKSIAVPFLPRELRFWDAATGEAKSTLTGPVVPTHLTFTADGKKLLLRADLGRFELWDLAAGKSVKEYVRQDDIFALAAIEPGGKWLATVSGASGKIKDVTVWGLGSGKAYFTVSGDAKSVTGLAISPDGGTLATVGTEGKIILWDPVEGKELAKLTAPKETGYRSGLAFTPDGKTLVSVTGIDVVRWDVGKRSVESQFKLPATLSALSDDGQWAALIRPGQIELWDTKEQKAVKTIPAEVASFGQVRFAPDRSFLALLSPTGVLRAWDTATGKERSGGAGHTAPVFTLGFAPDGKGLLSASGDFTARVWDPATGKELHQYGGMANGLQRAGYSADGKLVAAFGHGGILVYDAAGKQLHSLKDAGRTFAFAPDGKTLASISDKRNAEALHIWDLATGTETAQYAAPPNRPTTLLYSPDGKRLAVGNQTAGRVTDQKTELINPATGKTAHTVDGKPVAFSTDGKRLLAIDSDGLAFYDTANGKKLKAQSIRGLQVKAGAWSADGKLLALAQSGAITLFEAETGKELGRLTGHTGDVEVLAFSPDGTRLASSGKDTTIVVWDVTGVGK